MTPSDTPIFVNACIVCLLLALFLGGGFLYVLTGPAFQFMLNKQALEDFSVPRGSPTARLWTAADSLAWLCGSSARDLLDERTVQVSGDGIQEGKPWRQKTKQQFGVALHVEPAGPPFGE